MQRPELAVVRLRQALESIEPHQKGVMREDDGLGPPQGHPGQITSLLAANLVFELLSLIALGR